MRDNDRDLIAALAEGTLPPADAAALEAGLDEEGRAELAAQRFALHMMAAAPRPALSDLERERLHLRVLAEGRLTFQPASGRSGVLRWFPALAGVAATVTAVVVVAGLVGPFSGGGDDSGDGAFSAAETTITAASALTEVPESADFAARELGAGEAPEPGVGEVSSTTMAAGEAPDRLDALAGAYPAGTDLGALRKLVGLYDGPVVADPVQQPCYEQMAAADDRPILLAAPTMWDGRPVVMFFLEDGDEAGPPLRVYGVEGCELVASEGE